RRPRRMVRRDEPMYARDIKAGGSMRTTLGLVALVCFLSLSTTRAADSLGDGFSNPPDSAKPHTWWHWMNGNVTKEGITADLEAMKRVGIGGAQIFVVDEGIPAGKVSF